LHSGAQLLQSFVGEESRAFHEISPGDFVIGIRKLFREPGIIRENQQTAGIKVQTSGGRDERFDVGDEIVNGRPAFGVFIGRYVPGRFVEQDINPLSRFKRFPIEENAVTIEIDPAIRVFDDAAIDGDASRMNPAPGFAPRTDTGLR
jgi:hypothetical protein